MGRFASAVVALLAVVSLSTSAFAQGGGASSTGTIQGRVSDSQGAVLPGVTVTATSPSALGAQTTVTSETGNYRFPALPPGNYEVTYELAGFNTLKRSGIAISLGFVANVNVELALATLQETVTVSGASPVIDTTSTRVQQNFKMEQLQSIPNGRDMWALLAVTPAVMMNRVDVGGNRAGTQQGYAAYGQTGQVRVLIEGINTTEGTGGAGFYFDYASLEEAFLGTSGQSAEMPNPGVQSQFIARSGSNTFQGEYHLDWYNNSLQGSNIPDEYTVPTAFRNSPIREHSNEIDRYYDTDINVGGPVKRDKIWWFGTYRTQFNAIQQPNFQFDKTFNTKLWNAVGKGTYQINQKHKLVAYYQWGQKIQANRLPQSTYTYLDEGPTNRQDSGSWVYKAEWNGTLSDKLYVEARYGDFGYYFPLIANSDANFSWRDTGRSVIEGANQIWQLDRDRKQYNLAATYFLDTGAGSHTFKMGSELLKERAWEGYLQQYGGNIDHIYNNGVSNQVAFTFPTATDAGKLSAHSALTSKSALDVFGVFINDTWSFGRATVNAGLRYDRYHGWLPEQEQLAGSLAQWAPRFPALASAVTAKTFPETHIYTWNQIAPRIGLTFDLTGDGKTVLKGNYGLYWHNPGVGTGSNGNANTPAKNATYNWNDVNGDRRWQPGEETSEVSRSLEGTLTVDPNIKAPYSHEAAGWLERQLTDTMGVRAGFVYKTEDDLIATMQPDRPLSAFTVAYPFTDIGLDGRSGTADDRTLTFYGIPSATAGSSRQVVMNADWWSRYKTWEISLNKRYGNRWSGSMGFGHTWLTDFPNNGTNNTAPQRNPNNPGAVDRTLWNFKATATYDAAWGIRISPVLRHQSGENYARQLTISVPAALGLIATSNSTQGTIAYAEEANANRQDNIWVFDIRAEKSLSFTDRIRLRAYFDLFNITNSHASETITRSTGLSYQKPANILAPITGRVGFRFIF